MPALRTALHHWAFPGLKVTLTARDPFQARASPWRPTWLPAIQTPGLFLIRRLRAHHHLLTPLSPCSENTQTCLAWLNHCHAICHSPSCVVTTWPYDPTSTQARNHRPCPELPFCSPSSCFPPQQLGDPTSQLLPLLPVAQPDHFLAGLLTGHPHLSPPPTPTSEAFVHTATSPRCPKSKSCL